VVTILSLAFKLRSLAINVRSLACNVRFQDLAWSARVPVRPMHLECVRKDSTFTISAPVRPLMPGPYVVRSLRWNCRL
jgi:hypothetical protein